MSNFCPSADPAAVAEIQNYYGSLHISELLFQEIWKRQDFRTDSLKLRNGQSIQIINPGIWNHLDGPDFKSAIFTVNGITIEGDVELHLYPKEWVHHRHARDSNYDNVVLHVTLFNETKELNERNYPLHHLVLLPYISDDLEDLLTQYHSQRGDTLDPLLEPWAVPLFEKKNAADVHKLLLSKSKLRWQLKVAFAKKRIAQYGWEQACHQMMLEVMGYRQNRNPMHLLALNFPLDETPPIWSPDDVFERFRSLWKLGGVRPANQPYRRIQAYHQMISSNPGWPEKMVRCFEEHFRMTNECLLELKNPGNLRQIRKALNISKLLDSHQSRWLHSTVGGSRLHSLFYDAFLPLYTAQYELDLFVHWSVWQPGDFPRVFRKVLSETSLNPFPGAVFCNTWMQGCLQLSMENSGS